MPKAYWKGHEIFDIDCYKSGWAKILFWDNWFSSPITGTGMCWVLIDEIVIEEEA